MKKLSRTLVIALVMSLVCLSVWAAASTPRKPRKPPKPPGVGDRIVDFELRDLNKRKIPTKKARKGKSEDPSKLAPIYLDPIS